MTSGLHGTAERGCGKNLFAGQHSPSGSKPPLIGRAGGPGLPTGLVTSNFSSEPGVPHVSRFSRRGNAASAPACAHPCPAFSSQPSLSAITDFQPALRDNGVLIGAVLRCVRQLRRPSKLPQNIFSAL